MFRPYSEGGFFKARLTFPEDFPLNPPKLRFITPMWHPNSMSHSFRSYEVYSNSFPCAVYPDGNVCISILVSVKNVVSSRADVIHDRIFCSTHPVRTNTGMRTLASDGCLCTPWSPSYAAYVPTFTPMTLTTVHVQLLSVVSLLSAEMPNTDSPANVDAAKEIREDFGGMS